MSVVQPAGITSVIVTSNMSVLTWRDIQITAEDILEQWLFFDACEWIDEEELEWVFWKASEWIREAWEILSKAGLATYRTETEHGEVLIICLALIRFSLESGTCDSRDKLDFSCLDWAECLGISNYHIRQIIENISGIQLDKEDDDRELDQSQFFDVLNYLSKQVVTVLIKDFGSELELSASIGQSLKVHLNKHEEQPGEYRNTEKFKEEKEDYSFYRSETEALYIQELAEKLILDYEEKIKLEKISIAAERIVKLLNGENIIEISEEEEKEYARYWNVTEILNDITLADKVGNVFANRYMKPQLSEIFQYIKSTNLRISEPTIRRYHLALETRKFVILSGMSGTGKTWLTKIYAEAVQARYLLLQVAPNWTTNEDLLGYFNPIDKEYHYTVFSRFLEEAANEYQYAQYYQISPRPYHLVLDEMNLARVEYYFAKFLSAMEVRMREGEANIELAPDKQILLTPNLYFIGTVNVDETTHSFADKVYDRAQLIELEAPRQDLYEHLGNVPYREILMKIWDEVHTVAPFAFRVIDEIKTYVEEAEALDVSWQDALDEQLLQKILPKFKGTDERVGKALKAFVNIADEKGFPLSHKKANKMLETFNQHGFTSYF